MRFRLRVTRDNGSIGIEEVEASNFQEAKDIMLAEPDVIDATSATSNETVSMPGASSNGGMNGTIDQYVGTEQDVKDIIGF